MREAQRVWRFGVQVNQARRHAHLARALHIFRAVVNKKHLGGGQAQRLRGEREHLRVRFMQP